ncbi:MAG: hypothetical protein JSR45_10225 [Proteobacteria bacterium]|nr:hypothetical protein [Pseudomonadota bacterium]
MAKKAGLFQFPRAAIAMLLTAGSLGVLERIGQNYGLYQIRLHYGWQTHGLGPPVDPAALGAVALVAAACLPLGLIMLRGIDRERLQSWLGLLFGAIGAYALWGAQVRGLGDYLYDKGWQGLEAFGTRLELELLFFTPAFALAWLWLAMSERARERRLRAKHAAQPAA